MSGTDVTGLVRSSSLAVVAWVDGAGQPQARGAVALPHRGRPVLAFTYADEPVARDLAAAPGVALALHETRSTGAEFRPGLLSGRPLLTEDPSGELYVADLAVEELRRYPPSRLFADSPLLMREHWWYLPRLVVEIDVEAFEPLPRYDDPDHVVLVVAPGTAPVVRLAVIAARTEGRLELSVDGADVPPGSAVVFGQDASFPDLERWSQWKWRGTWDGAGVDVEEAPSRTGLGPPPGLLQRWRRQRALERGCVAAIPRN